MRERGMSIGGQIYSIEWGLFEYSDMLGEVDG